MEAIKLPGMNRELSSPEGWDAEKHGECTPLPVFAEVKDGAMVLTSAWQPNAEELAHLAAGAAVACVVYGTVHPPIALGVFEQPLDMYAVPPSRQPAAPGVDLEQFRESVEQEYSRAVDFADPSAESKKHIAEAKAKRDRLLALIDDSPKGGSDARELFEVWARQEPRCFNITRDGAGYYFATAQDSWVAWQAALQATRSRCSAREPGQ